MEPQLGWVGRDERGGAEGAGSGHTERAGGGFGGGKPEVRGFLYTSVRLSAAQSSFGWTYTNFGRTAVGSSCEAVPLVSDRRSGLRSVSTVENGSEDGSSRRVAASSSSSSMASSESSSVTPL